MNKLCLSLVAVVIVTAFAGEAFAQNSGSKSNRKAWQGFSMSPGSANRREGENAEDPRKGRPIPGSPGSSLTNGASGSYFGEGDTDRQEINQLCNLGKWRLVIKRGFAIQQRPAKQAQLYDWTELGDSDLAATLMDAYLQVGEVDNAVKQFKLYMAAQMAVMRRQIEQERETRERMGNDDHSTYKLRFLGPDGWWCSTVGGGVTNAKRFLRAGDSQRFLDIVAEYEDGLNKASRSDSWGQAHEALALIQAVRGNRTEAIQKLHESEALYLAARHLQFEAANVQNANPDEMANTDNRLLISALSHDWDGVRKNLKANLRFKFPDYAMRRFAPLESRDGLNVFSQEFGQYQLVPLWNKDLGDVGFEYTCSVRESQFSTFHQFASRAKRADDAAIQEAFSQAADLFLQTYDAISVKEAEFAALSLLRHASHAMMDASWAGLQKQYEGMTNQERMKQEFGAKWIDYKDIQSRLSDNQRVLEFVKGRTIDTSEEAKGFRFTPTHYAAWVLKKNGPPRFVDIGLASEIDPLIQEMRHAIQKTEKEGITSSSKAIELSLQKLGQRLIKPFDAELKDADSLVICPDGELWLLPWAALPTGDGANRLLEKCALSFRFTATSLLSKDSEQIARLGPPVIITNPDYNASADQIQETNEQHSVPEPRFAETIGKFGGARLLPNVRELTDTENEAKAIVPSLAAISHQPPVTYTRRGACESLIRSDVRNPEYLIFQTHGFFLPDFREQGESQHGTTSSEQQYLAETSRAIDDFYSYLPNSRRPLEIADPMMRCGLILAGANRIDDWKSARGADGILTAKEAALMDLRGTKMVVLSACETGVGDAPAGEGVASLHQAFLMAGSESVVASLWKVENQSTIAIMTEFFKGLKAGQPRNVALRNAQLSVMRSRSSENRSASPYYWAAFTLTER